MAYAQTWAEAVPAGSDPANEIDTYIQNDKIATRERLADILGIADFTLDPIVPTTLKLNRTANPTILGGTVSFAVRNSADSANNLLLTDAGIATLRNNLLFATDNSSDVGASGATRPRTIYVGTSIVVPTVTATTLTGTLSTAAQPNITSLGTLPTATITTLTSTTINATTLNGTIGTASQPNITSLGTLAANLIFVDNTYDIGASGATRPRHIYVAQNIVFGGSITGSGASLTALNATQLTSGTIPDARFPATLPVANGSNLTNLNASNLASGIVPSARITTLQDLAAHILFPVDNTYDIGASGATRPRNVYVAGTLVAGASSFLGTSFTGHVTFTPDNTYDLGASGSNRPRTLYVGTSVVVPTVTATTLTGTLSTAAQTNITSLGTLAAHLLFVDNTYDIGASGATRPRSIFLGTAAYAQLFSVVVAGSGRGGLYTWNNVIGSGTDYSITLFSESAIYFGTNGSASIRWTITTTGHLITGADNSHDIGQSGSNRPRNLYVGTSATIPTINANSIISTSSSANPTLLKLYNAINSASAFGIDFYRDADGGNDLQVAYIKYTRTGGNVGDLIFGTGTAGSIATKWRMMDTGHLLAENDNSYDIGTSGAARPRSIFVGSNLKVYGDSNSVQFGSGTAFGNLGSGFMTLSISGPSGGGIWLGSNGSTDDSGYIAANSGGLGITSPGTNKDLYFGTAVGVVWKIKSAGHFIAETDNTYDIGASGATRPRSIYVGTSIIVPTVTATTITASTSLTSILVTINSANNAYGLDVIGSAGGASSLGSRITINDTLGGIGILVRGSGGNTKFQVGLAAGGDGTITVNDNFVHNGTPGSHVIGFYGASAFQQTVTGSRGGNVALASLLTALAAYGIIVDSSS